MKKIILIGLFFISHHLFSQQKIDLHLPRIKNSQINFYDFKYQMKDKYYFKGDMLNWSNLRLKGQFILPTKWGIIYINIILPPVIQQGISLNIK